MDSAEKRRAQRKDVVIQASVSREGVSWSSSDIEVKTVNLSRNGAMLTSPELMGVGEQLSLMVSKPNGGFGTIPARVVWNEKGEAGVYRIGIAFRNLSPDEAYLVDLHLVRSS